MLLSSVGQVKHHVYYYIVTHLSHTLLGFGILPCCYDCFRMMPKWGTGHRHVNRRACFREGMPPSPLDGEEHLAENLTGGRLARLGTPQQAQGALNQPSTGTPLSEAGDGVSASTSATSFRPHMRKPPADIYGDGQSSS